MIPLTPSQVPLTSIMIATAELVVAIPPTSDQLPLPSTVIYTADPAVAILLTPDQVSLPPSDVASYGIATTRGGISGYLARALHFHQSVNDLTNLLFVALLTNIHMFVESLFACHTTISRLRAAMRADLKGFLIWDGTIPTPDDLDNL